MNYLNLILSKPDKGGILIINIVMMNCYTVLLLII